MMPVTMRQGPIVFAHRGGGEEAPAPSAPPALLAARGTPASSPNLTTRPPSEPRRAWMRL